MKKEKAKLTEVFHKWVKQQYSIDGWVCCFTCGKGFELGDSFIHAGHWLPKSANPGLRFHPDNVRPQCQTCNFNNGERDKFEQALRLEIGNSRVDWLLDNRFLAESDHSPEWYQEKIDFYKGDL